MFTRKFDRYVCEYDQIACSIDGFDITASVVYDHDTGIDDDDCHNIDQGVTGCNDEQQERLLAARAAWFNDQWFYCGIVIRVEKNGITIDDHAASLWGIEANYPGNDNSYLNEVANELLPEAIEHAKATLQRMIEKLTA